MHPESAALESQLLADIAGNRHKPPAKMRKAREASQSEQSVRKRARTAETGSDEKLDEKRSRGRPRLNTQDETAADRRRTQIRLAQRAYRNRKDAAITSLEQKVKDLEDANDGMSKAFSSFYEYALSQGLLNAAPEAARRLKDLTETFMRLGNKGSQDEDLSSRTASPDQAADVVFDEVDRHPSMSSSSTVEGSPKSLRLSATPVEFPSAQTVGGMLSLPPDPTLALNPLPYEVIAQPTPDNASYPFYALSQPEQQPQPQFGSMDGFPIPDFFSSLSFPESYASHESTFGRRLHRTTVEAGLRLASMESPPPEQYAAVFGFCLLFEDRKSIVDRLTVAANRGGDESMSYWKTPFTNLGGAGMYFTGETSAGEPFASGLGNDNMGLGDHSYHEFFKPQEATGFSMGPFDSHVQSVADNWLESRTRMLLPDFEGSFFEPLEVEKYLAARGVHIPPRADFVDVVIDIEDFKNDSNDYWPTGSLERVAEPCNDPAIAATKQPSLDPGTEHPDSDSGPGFSYCPLFINKRWERVGPTKYRVIIDVAILIDEIIGKAVCLSRTPGFRPKHINHALKVAVGLVPRTQPGGKC